MFTDPFNDIAEAFNNYDVYQYTNPTYELNENDTMVCLEGYTFAFQYVKTFNPSNSERPLRVGSVLKDKLSTLKTDYDIAMNQFKTKTGENGNGCLQSYFYSKCNGLGYLLYIYLIWGDKQLLMVGKSIPIEMSSDSGIAGMHGTETPCMVRGKRERKTPNEDKNIDKIAKIDASNAAMADAIKTSEKYNTNARSLYHLQLHASTVELRSIAEYMLFESVCEGTRFRNPLIYAGNQDDTRVHECHPDIPMEGHNLNFESEYSPHTTP